ncbi:MAG: hypothetical protein JNM56_03040 [Planctomycetia bacterium]|nr:hypothetical protein [Planctomycetia bacterium]
MRRAVALLALISAAVSAVGCQQSSLVPGLLADDAGMPNVSKPAISDERQTPQQTEQPRDLAHSPVASDHAAPLAPVATTVGNYLIIFSSDTTPYRPTQAHTFAAVVRVAESDDSPPSIVEVASLSWLPATRQVRALALWCETGKNVPLHETISSYIDDGGKVRMWGPYRVLPELIERFKAHVADVESSYRYKGACFLTPSYICDCTRSVEVLVGTAGRYIGVCGYGAAASSHCVREMTPWLIDPAQDHPWVATLLGLDRYPLVRLPFGQYISRWDQFQSMIDW